MKSDNDNLLDGYKPDDFSVKRETVMPNLKVDINEFLFARVPDSMTVKGLDMLAFKVFNLIESEWLRVAATREGE